jgi:predicted O-methyltransferase YrrM
MPLRLTGRQAVLAAGVLVLVVAGAGTAVFADPGVAVALLLLLQVPLLLGLFLLRNQLGRLQRRVSADIPAQVARLETAVEAVRSGALLREVLDVVGQDRLDAAVRYRELNAAVAELAALPERVTALATEVEQTREQLAAQGRQVTQQVQEGLHQVTADSWFLLNLLQVVDVEGPFPAPGGAWALTPQTLLALVSHVQAQPGPVLALECGSGTSTVWLAAVMRQRRSGRVVALEHDEQFARRTREDLARLGLDGWAEVRHAPLQERELAGERFAWYDLAAVADLGPVDLLFVDGPPGYVADTARYPAVPLLAPLLAPGAVVVLDDVGRPAEDEVARRWTGTDFAGRRLEPTARLDRSQFFTVVAARAGAGGGVPAGARAAAADDGDV